MVCHVNVFEQAIAAAPVTPPDDLSEGVSGPHQSARPKTVRRGLRASIPFVRGPIPLRWLTKAVALSRSAARLSVALWYRLGLTGQHVDLTAPAGQSLTVRIDTKLRDDCDLERWHVSDGMADLCEAGLIRVVKGGRGRCPEVAIIAQPEETPASQTSVP
jgi:hypothetical protein